MLRAFSHNELELQTIAKGDELFFKGKDVCDALEYDDAPGAIRKHVSDKYKVRLSEIRGGQNDHPLKGGPQRTSLANEQPHTVFVKEPGLYELIFSSKLPATVEFREWVFEEVLPTLRKTGRYAAFNTPNPLVFKIENENDLHYKVVDFIDRFYPDLIHIAGLGELQYKGWMRIEGKKKGYLKGQPDLVIPNCHKYYTGLCIEMKTPKGTGKIDDEQRILLERYKKTGFKVVISNDYDVIIKEIIEYCRDIRIPCPHCSKKFVKDITLNAHLRWFHRISERELSLL